MSAWEDKHKCYSCRYSAPMANGLHLFCTNSKHVLGITSGCPWYEREPGADIPTEEEMKAVDDAYYALERLKKKAAS